MHYLKRPFSGVKTLKLFSRFLNLHAILKTKELQLYLVNTGNNTPQVTTAVEKLNKLRILTTIFKFTKYLIKLNYFHYYETIH